MKSPDVAGTTVGGRTTYTLFTLLNADTKSIVYCCQCLILCLTGLKMGSYLDSCIVPLINIDYQQSIKKHVYCLAVIIDNCIKLYT